MKYGRDKTNADRWIPTRSPLQCPVIRYDSGVIELVDGATYNSASRDLCYLGLQAATPVDLVEDFDCESYVETAPRMYDLPYFAINSREIKTWNLRTSITGGLSCPEQLVSWCLIVAYVELV